MRFKLSDVWLLSRCNLGDEAAEGAVGWSEGLGTFAAQHKGQMLGVDTGQPPASYLVLWIIPQHQW